MASAPSSRLAYIDWLRGLACVLMFQTHCYDAWLGGSARNSTFFMWSQILGTFPAPLFLFLAGVSFALVTDKLLQKGLPAGQIARTTIRRGAEIFALGLLFRLQEYVIAWGWASWSDLLRVDILNTIGFSMMLMGLVCWIVLACVAGRRRPARTGEDARPYTNLVTAAIFVAAAIATFAPLLWTTWRPRFLPWPIESYVNGVHNLGSPQAWLFPVFPWTAFAFAGLAFGFLLLSDSGKRLGARAFLLAGVAGIVLISGSKFLDSRSLQIYPVYDYWHTSPNFFLIRLGLLLLLVVSGYTWCRWGLGQRGFSPLIQLGRTSLLVYWVHIEFVYGRVSILPRRGESILGASAGLLIIFLAMLTLSILQTKWKGRTGDLLSWRPGLSRSA
jgi:uncharacterized membrane protein